jgi:hypothetical protein
MKDFQVTYKGLINMQNINRTPEIQQLQKTNNPNQKWAKGLNRCFFQKKKKSINGHLFLSLLTYE